MSWGELGEWWQSEVSSDPAYEQVVTPMLLEILNPRPARVYLDLGSGEGRVMRSIIAGGSDVHGIELNRELARISGASSPTVVAELPDLSFVTDDAYDGAYCVLVLEHIVDHRRLFAETARVVRDGGVFALVMNHPIWTAPDSTPITDDDGEVLWRPGQYFSSGSVEEPAGPNRTVAFHHRAMSDVMNAAADAGWRLARMLEAPHHELKDQGGIPRLLACRWVM
jgi:SAM-dependent methyltransferase